MSCSALAEGKEESCHDALVRQIQMFGGTFIPGRCPPYEGRRTSMYVFLPARRRTMEEFEQILSSDEGQGWMPHFEPVRGLGLALPDWLRPAPDS
jgi:hypothetical protein